MGSVFAEETPSLRFRRTVLRRILGAGGILIATLAVSYGGTRLFLAHIRMDGGTINLSGRQRMFIQQITSLSHQRRAETDRARRAELDRRLRSAIGEMEKNQALILAGKLPDDLADLYHGAGRLDARIREFLTAASLPEGQPAPQEQIDLLMREVDRATLLFQNDWEEDHGTIGRIQLIALLLSLGMIVFCGLLVFRPLISELGALTRSMLAEKRKVQLLFEVAAVANSSKRFEEALERCLLLIGRHTGAPVGHAYLPDPEGADRLLPANHWYLSDPSRFEALVTRIATTELRAGDGLPGWVAREKRPAWAATLEIDPRCPIKPALIDSGLRSGFAFPILAEDRLVAVLEFFSEVEMERDEEILEIAAQVAVHLGNVHERQASRQHLIDLSQSLEAKVEERTRALVSAQARLAGSAKLAALGQLAGGIAHEINTPLATIQLARDQLEELLGGDPIDHPSVTRMLQAIAKTIVKISSIIRGVRLLARSDQNGDFLPTAARQIVEEALNLCAEALTRNGVRVLTDPIPADVTIPCREVQLCQVLVNLIKNASDAVATGPERWIRVSVESTEDGAEISVADSGAGIPKEIRDRLFEPFFTTKDIGEGTGLGLSISRELVAAHGGTLELDENSKETRFVIRLPKLASAAA